MFRFITKNPTPQQLAMISAVNIGGMTLIAVLLIKLILPSALAWWMVIAFPLISFGSSYYTIHESLRLFIYRKIKLIYKSIHRLKAPVGGSPTNVNMRDHIIDQVEEEVVEWAQDWTKEIKLLKEMEEYRREFLGNVSHELKTPIFNIQGYLETLLDGAMENPEIAKKYLKRANSNASRMANIVEDLGYVSKFEAGKISLDLERFNLHELAQEVLEDMELSASQKEIKLEFKDRNPKPLWVMADRSNIQRVLINLVSNSIKYGRKGGKTLIGFYDLDKNVLLEISDNGRGIAQEHIPRLFERFYRVDKGRSRADGGSGLGLAIVKHIVEAHNQTINVRSRADVGSTFGFTLQKA
ncbi:MAG: sensor histidine kinase [Aureispira sp.]|nr:sensor histidine kinase [Aureispira sp.]